MPKAPKRKADGRARTSSANGRKGGRPLAPAGMESIAKRRAEARLAMEEANAAMAQADAEERRGTLALRSEAIAEAQRLGSMVNKELRRAKAFLDPALAPEVRAAAEQALAVAAGRILTALAKEARGG